MIVTQFVRRKCISLLRHRLPILLTSTEFLFLKHGSIFYSTQVFDPEDQDIKTSKTIGGHQRKNTPKSYHEFLYGRSACQIALKVSKRPIFKVVANEALLHSYINDKRIHDILHMAAERNIPIEYRSVITLFNLSKGRPHQGVCLKVGHYFPIAIDDEKMQTLFSEPVSSQLPLWVFLDGLKDPMNVGAILRTCYFLGINNVVLYSCSPITGSVTKASGGASEILSIYSVDNLKDFFKVLENSGWDIIGTDAFDSKRGLFQPVNYKSCNVVGVHEAHLSKPSFLVLGGEGHGMSNITRSSCSKFITIKSDNNCNDHYLPCLNVSAAAGKYTEQTITV